MGNAIHIIEPEEESSNELRTCPFCGGESAFIGDTKTIKCKLCGGAFLCTNPLISRLEVAKAWNRRTTDGAPKD